MSGFFACPPEAWETVAEVLPMPWRAEWAAADLRYWVDWIGGSPRRALPTEAVLCKRWGWGNRAVRTLLTDVAGWADPHTDKLAASIAAVAAAKARAPRRGDPDSAQQERSRSAAGAQQERSRSAAGAQQERSSAAPANADNPDAAQQERSRSAAGAQQERSTHARDLRAGSPSTGSQDHDLTSVGRDRAPDPEPPQTSLDRATGGKAVEAGLPSPPGELDAQGSAHDSPRPGPPRRGDRGADPEADWGDSALTPPTDDRGGGREGPDRDSPPATPPPELTWPHPAAEALALAVPELTRELQDPAAWRVATRLDPSDVAQVVAWALTSPDAAAERLRLEHRVHRRDVSIVPRPRLHPRWLCDGIAWGERLGFADRWEAQGRPEAPDAFGPPESESERSEASRVEQLQRASQLWDAARTEEQRDRARSWYRLLEALRAPRPAPRVTDAAPRRGPGGGWSAVGTVALEMLPPGGGRR